MSDIAWDTVFREQIERCPGADDAQLAQFIGSVQQPISPHEMAELPAHFSADRWIIRSAPLPDSYLSFLRWSNGGEFRNGDRLMQFFSTFSPTHSVRAMLLAYGVPHFLPGVLPFAINGGGIFYAFDLRFQSVHGEYAIVAAECCHAHVPYVTAPTFLEACRSTVDFEVPWDEQDEWTQPKCDECEIPLVCPGCGKPGRVAHN